MTRKWNLQDIRPPEPRENRRPSQIRPLRPSDNNVPNQTPVVQKVTRETIPTIVIENGPKRDKNRIIISLIVFVAFVSVGMGLSVLLGKNELTVTPKYRQPNVSAEFVAYPEQRSGELSYTVMTLEDTGERQVTATGQVLVEEQAVGFIEINKSTPGAERLKKNTRFRTVDGKIYRIFESVVVPGSVINENGSNVPGSIRARVFADEAGDKYNIPAGEKFNVPGFEESGSTVLYNAITATNPEPITGGYSGPRYEINPAELATARQALQVELRDKLLARIEGEKPAGQVWFKGSIAITFNELPTTQFGQNLVTLKEQAIMQIPLFEKIAFGSFIASQTVPGYSGEPVRVEDPTTLTFSYSNPTTSSSVIANEPSLSFSLSGKPLLVWEFDVDKLKKDLSGSSKTALFNIVELHSGIDSANARITPFWRRSFPEEPSEITVIESLDIKNEQD